MLIKYAPDIDGSILDRLVATFAELRSLADQGEFIFSIVTLSPKNTPEIDYPKKRAIKKSQKPSRFDLDRQKCVTLGY